MSSCDSEQLSVKAMPLAQAMQTVLMHGSSHKRLPRIPLANVVLGNTNLFKSDFDPQDYVYKEEDEDGADVQTISHGVSLLPDLDVCAEPVCGIAGTLSGAVEVQVRHKVQPKPVPVYMQALQRTKQTASDVTKPLDPVTDGSPAGYGDLATGTTKFDPHVRKARVLSPGDVSVKLSAVDLDHITHQVEQHLFPHCVTDSKHVQLRLSKVNIYGPGDFFGKHVDTPRQGVWGTVVVVAARDMFGASSDGGLVLYSDVGSGSGAPQTTLREPVTRDAPVFMAFYSDVVHEVQPVSSGFRVSITYDVMVRGPRKTPAAPPGPMGGSVIQSPSSALPCLASPCSRVEALRLLHHVQDEGALDVIVLCSHKYSFDEVDAGVLKGVDALLATMFRAFTDRKDMQLVPLALKTHIQVDVGEHAELPKIDIDLYRMTRSDLVRAVTDATGLGYDGAHLTMEKSHVLLVPTSALLHVVGDHVDRGTEYTGNESRPTVIDCRYWVCGMVFHRQTYGGPPRPPWNWVSNSLTDTFPTVGGVATSSGPGSRSRKRKVVGGDTDGNEDGDGDGDEDADADADAVADADSDTDA
jgi:hypothetical protein